MWSLLFSVLALSACNVLSLRQRQTHIIDNLNLVWEKEAAHLEHLRLQSVFAESCLFIVRSAVISSVLDDCLSFNSWITWWEEACLCRLKTNQSITFGSFLSDTSFCIWLDFPECCYLNYFNSLRETEMLYSVKTWSQLAWRAGGVEQKMTAARPD